MAYTTINKSSDYFNTKLYTGNGSTNAITGVGFQPDWVWVKNRDIGTDAPTIYDAVRGATKRLQTSSDGAESTKTNGLTAFNSDGYTAGSASAINANGSNIASWNWLANGAGSANTDGSISSTVSANTTSGFSIVSFTGTGSASTIGHGLNAVPKMYIVKNRSTASTQWRVYHASLGATKHMALDATQAVGTASSVFNNTEPTSSVFSVGTDDAANKSGDSLIAYCFAEKQGFSKFGSYVGNGSATNGTFVYTGFKPAWLMVKNTATTSSWEIWDVKRNTFNPTAKSIFPDGSGAEYDYTNRVDLLSNGFKLKTTSSPNGSGNSIIYMAFAEAPLVGSNNVPCTAR